MAWKRPREGQQHARGHTASKSRGETRPYGWLTNPVQRSSLQLAGECLQGTRHGATTVSGTVRSLSLSEHTVKQGDTDHGAE